MSVYLVGAIQIEDPERYALYSAGARQALAPFNVEVLSVDDTPEIVEGTPPANHHFIIRFASEADFHAFHASEAYQTVVGHRHAASTARFIMLMRGRDEIDAR